MLEKMQETLVGLSHASMPNFGDTDQQRRNQRRCETLRVDCAPLFERIAASLIDYSPEQELGRAVTVRGR